MLLGRNIVKTKLMNRLRDPTRKYRNADVKISAARNIEMMFATAAKIPPRACPASKADSFSVKLDHLTLTFNYLPLMVAVVYSPGKWLMTDNNPHWNREQKAERCQTGFTIWILAFDASSKWYSCTGKLNKFFDYKRRLWLTIHQDHCRHSQNEKIPLPLKAQEKTHQHDHFTAAWYRY